MINRALLNSMLYFPSREFLDTPARAGLAYRDAEFETDDGERLHGWWVEARADRLGAVLLCHGNAGNVGDRVLHADLLTAAGFDVLLFDYRGYGRSTGRPGEDGTYRDARAARDWLLDQLAGAAPGRVIYLGESLGGAVALELALAHPPAGLALLSTFTSVRAMARAHYGVIPAPLVPDAYPSLDRIAQLRAPLLVLHGDRDDIVPVGQAEELFSAAPEPKRMRVFPGTGHNDLIASAGAQWAREVAEWARELEVKPPS